MSDRRIDDDDENEEEMRYLDLHYRHEWREDEQFHGPLEPEPLACNDDNEDDEGQPWLELEDDKEGCPDYDQDDEDGPAC